MLAQRCWKQSSIFFVEGGGGGDGGLGGGGEEVNDVKGFKSTVSLLGGYPWAYVSLWAGI